MTKGLTAESLVTSFVPVLPNTLGERSMAEAHGAGYEICAVHIQPPLFPNEVRVGIVPSAIYAIDKIAEGKQELVNIARKILDWQKKEANPEAIEIRYNPEVSQFFCVFPDGDTAARFFCESGLLIEPNYKVRKTLSQELQLCFGEEELSKYEAYQTKIKPAAPTESDVGKILNEGESSLSEHHGTLKRMLLNTAAYPAGVPGHSAQSRGS